MKLLVLGLCSFVVFVVVFVFSDLYTKVPKLDEENSSSSTKIIMLVICFHKDIFAVSAFFLFFLLFFLFFFLSFSFDEKKA